MALQPQEERARQEFLEQLWTAEEDGVRLTVEELLGGTGLSRADWEQAALEERGLVSVDEAGRLSLTASGRDYGRRIVRRHRLAERLLVDVLNMGESEEAACRFEHAIDEHMAEHICTLLGHPATCPHGKPIPPGDCCRNHESAVRSAVRSLADLRPGERGTVLYIASRDDAVLHRLAALGIVPGAELTLHQDRPGRVVRVGATQVALDAETVRNIYVRPAPGTAFPETPRRGRWRWGAWRRRGQ